MAGSSYYSRCVPVCRQAMVARVEDGRVISRQRLDLPGEIDAVLPGDSLFFVAMPWGDQKTLIVNWEAEFERALQVSREGGGP